MAHSMGKISILHDLIDAELVRIDILMRVIVNLLLVLDAEKN